MKIGLVVPGSLTVLVVAALSCHSSVVPSATTERSHWPDEPSGLVTLTDRAWNELVGNGWNRRESADDRIVPDPTAPVSPATALEYVFPVGFDGGRAPATHYYSLGDRKELFVGLEWKVSTPWQGHASAVNKIQFAYTGSSDVAMVMYGQNGGPYELRVMPQWPEHGSAWLTPNVNNTPLSLGQWHRLEWYLRYESSYGAADGVVRWWLDGSLGADYTNVRYPRDDGFTEYQISPTWGGVGDVKREADYYRFNRSYISSR
jgi:hypothetical protein